MTNKEIFGLLKSFGMTDEGACGLMGNMAAESTMKPTIAQRGMTTMSDEEYTFAADNGMIDFAGDSVGYGLCQWTSSDRKAALLAYAKSRGTSVGDAETQVRFAVRELQSGYHTLFLKLCTSHDIDECSDRVCDTYERPEVNNYQVRRDFAREFYSAFRGSAALASQMQQNQASAAETQQASPAQTPSYWDWKIALIQYVMQCDGYWAAPDGLKSEAFFNALKQYTEDMQRC